MKGAQSKITSNGNAEKLTRTKSSAGKTIALSYTTAKIAAQVQFDKIKQALKEVDEIEAGRIKPKSLGDLLHEL